MFKSIVLKIALIISLFFVTSIGIANGEEKCDSTGCINSANFEINVDSISPGMNVGKFNGDTKKTVNFAFATIIQKLMIGLGSLSLLIMTVGAGYIVLHNGQDELLNKGKSIFMSGVYAMVVALSSYYIIVIVRYILYGNGNS